MMEFITDHYLLLMIVIAFIIFAIIGYIVDSTKNKKTEEKSFTATGEEEIAIPVSDEPTIAPEVAEPVGEETTELPAENSTNEPEFVLTDSDKKSNSEAKDNK